MEYPIMRIAIIDHDREQGALMEASLHAYGNEHALPLQISRYADGESFQADFRHQFDLILLDISLPGMNGIQAARILREKDNDVAILFLSQAAQDAMFGYEVDALDFILKPIDHAAFSQCIHRAITRIRDRNTQYLLVTDRNGSARLAVDEICYIESRGHDLVYHTANGSHTVKGTISDAEQQLAPRHFFRCNKGYLISLRHVEGVRNGCALVHGTALLISRPRKKKFLQALTDYYEGTLRS